MTKIRHNKNFYQCKYLIANRFKHTYVLIMYIKFYNYPYISFQGQNILYAMTCVVKKDLF